MPDEINKKECCCTVVIRILAFVVLLLVAALSAISQNTNKGKDGSLNEKIEIKFSNLFFKIIIPIYLGVIISAVIAYLIVMTCTKSLEFEHIVFVAIFMIIAVAVAPLMLETSKSFAKMAFLKGIIESNAKSEELIKKVCDTLAEL